MAPPAVSSQTSLPSHTGPTALRHMRRSVSSRLTSGLTMATPKSNPSRKKYPAHRSPMSANHVAPSPVKVVMATTPQSSESDSVDEPVDEGGIGSVFVDLIERMARRTNDQNHGDDSERRVHSDEDRQGEGHIGGRHR